MRNSPKKRNRRARNAHRLRKRLVYCGLVIFVAIRVLAYIAEISGVNLETIIKHYKNCFALPQAPPLIFHSPSPPIESILFPQPKRKITHVAPPVQTFSGPSTFDRIANKNWTPAYYLNWQFPGLPAQREIQHLLSNDPNLAGGGSQKSTQMLLVKHDQVPTCKYTSAGKPESTIEVPTGFSLTPHDALTAKNYPAVPPSCVPDKEAERK